MPGRRSSSRAAAYGMVMLLAGALALAGCASGISGSGTSGKLPSIKVQAAPVDPLTETQATMLDQARLKVDAEDYNGAADLLQTLHNARPDRADILAKVGWVRQRQGAEEQAMQAYQTALDIDPTERMAANNLALMRQDAGDFPEARSLLQQALSGHPDSPELHYNLAVLAELYLLDLPLALEHYRIYQSLTDAHKKQVSGWIADLERRVN